MTEARDQILEAILTSIEGARLPDSHTGPLRDAIVTLYETRPNAVNKVQAPLGRALRNPLFPGLWTRCVDDIPGSDDYEPLRKAAQDIATLVKQVRDNQK